MYSKNSASVFLVVLFSLIYSNLALAISESNFESEYQANVLPLIHSMESDSFDSHGVKIHYQTLINPTATRCLVILPGRSEPAIKYAEMVYDLNQMMPNKLSFFILDHRGQGQSDRMTSKLDMGYVDHFENYVSDFEYFIKNVLPKAFCEKKFLFAHSMGAGIGLSYVTTHDKFFDGIAVSSPMLKIQTKPYSYAVAKTIVTSMMVIGRGDEFAIGQNGFNPLDKFEDNKFTTSRIRFDKTMQIFKDYPETQLGGVSNRWIYEVMKGTQKLRNKYKAIKVPLKVYRAGVELYSEPLEMHKLCQEALQCDEMVLADSKHEVLNDRDVNRQQVLSSLVQFFNQFK